MLVGGRLNLVYSPGPGLSPGTLDLLDLTWDLGPGPELDNNKLTNLNVEMLSGSVVGSSKILC